MTDNKQKHEQESIKSDILNLRHKNITMELRTNYATLIFIKFGIFDKQTQTFKKNIYRDRKTMFFCENLINLFLLNNNLD